MFCEIIPRASDIVIKNACLLTLHWCYEVYSQIFGDKLVYLHALIYASSAIVPVKLLSQLNQGCSYNQATMQDLNPITDKMSKSQHLDS